MNLLKFVPSGALLLMAIFSLFEGRSHMLSSKDVSFTSTRSQAVRTKASNAQRVGGQILAKENRKERRQLIERFALDLAEENPATALEWALNISSLEDRMSALKAILNSAERVEELAIALTKLNEVFPLFSIRGADGDGTDPFFAFVTRLLSETSEETAVNWLNKNFAGNRLRKLKVNLFFDIADGDINVAKRLANEESELSIKSEMMTGLMYWMIQDFPEESLKFYAKNYDLLAEKNSFLQVIGGLALNGNVVEKLEEISNLSPNIDISEVIRGMAVAVVHRDGASAFSILDSVEDSAIEEQLRNEIWDTMVEQDPSSAWEIAKEDLDEVELVSLADKVAKVNLTAGDFEDAAGILLEVSEQHGTTNNSLIRDVVQNWASSDIEKAAAWLIEVNTGPFLDAGILGLAPNLENSEELAAWIDGISNADLKRELTENYLEGNEY